MGLSVQTVRGWVAESTHCAQDCTVLIAEPHMIDDHVDDSRDVTIERHGESTPVGRMVAGVFNTFTKQFDTILFGQDAEMSVVKMLIEEPRRFIDTYTENEDQQYLLSATRL